MRHTAFVRDDPTLLAARLAEVSGEAIGANAHEPVTVEAESSATHVAERFLHSDIAAIAVVRKGTFLGMLSLADFCRAMMRIQV